MPSAVDLLRQLALPPIAGWMLLAIAAERTERSSRSLLPVALCRPAWSFAAIGASAMIVLWDSAFRVCWLTSTNQNPSTFGALSTTVRLQAGWSAACFHELPMARWARFHSWRADSLRKAP